MSDRQRDSAALHTSWRNLASCSWWTRDGPGTRETAACPSLSPTGHHRGGGALSFLRRVRVISRISD